MQPSPLQLNKSLVGAVSVTPLEGETPSPNTVNVTVTPTFRRHEKLERDWMVTLKLTFKGVEGKPAPYSGEIEVQGFFRIAADYPAEKMNKMLAVSAPTLLYSTAREVIASITGRGPHGVFLLPSVTFSDHDLIIGKRPSLPGK